MQEPQNIPAPPAVTMAIFMEQAINSAETLTAVLFQKIKPRKDLGVDCCLFVFLREQPAFHGF
jgi:hypothetical protein